MIGKLKGIVEDYGEDWVLVDVQGVCYHVTCSFKTLGQLPPKGEFAEVLTEMLVSETSIRLVGFATGAEREWFRLLDNVQGVGTKVALAILSTLTTGDLHNAVALGDKAMIGRSPGVGPRLAQRIVSELRDKAPGFAAPDPALAQLQGALQAPTSTAAADAVSALVNLGYGQAQAGAAVATGLRKAGDEASVEMLIRHALKELAS